LNDGQIQNPSNPFGIVPLFNFVPRGFGFVHHSIAVLYHEVPNPNLTIRNFFIAVFWALQDLSVQKLVVLLAGGGLPALKRLLLGNNKFAATGRTMLKGLAMLRKGLVVKHENELD
jgi:hypothetical protein